MPALTDRQLVELTNRQHRRILSIRNSVGVEVGRLWDRLRPIGDDSARRFARAAAAAVASAQSTASTTTAGFLKIATGSSGPTTPIVGIALRGIDPITVYMRGIISARAHLASGGSPTDALRIGRERSVSTAQTDVMLAQRAAVDEWAKADRIVGYRRVLTGASCVLCATASTQRYHRGDLMPIHPRCDCGIAPIIGKSDPGHVINRPLLKQLQQLGPNYWLQNGLVDADGNFILSGVVPPDTPRASSRPQPASPPKPTPAPGTQAPASWLEWASPKALRDLGPTMDRLAELHGVPTNTLPPTKVRLGGKSQFKGGHFRYGQPKISKPRRVRGQSLDDYLVRLRAYNAEKLARRSEFETEILILDRGDTTGLLSFLHEFGHRLDFERGLGFKTRNATASATAIVDFLNAARLSPTIANATRNYADQAFVRYFRDPIEVWARAYSQWAALKLGGPELAALRAAQAAHANYQWSDSEFDTLSPLVEGVLRSWGMIA